MRERREQIANKITEARESGRASHDNHRAVAIFDSSINILLALNESANALGFMLSPACAGLNVTFA